MLRLFHSNLRESEKEGSGLEIYRRLAKTVEKERQANRDQDQTNEFEYSKSILVSIDVGSADGKKTYVYPERKGTLYDADESNNEYLPKWLQWLDRLQQRTHPILRVDVENEMGEYECEYLVSAWRNPFAQRHDTKFYDTVIKNVLYQNAVEGNFDWVDSYNRKGHHGRLIFKTVIYLVTIITWGLFFKQVYDAITGDMEMVWYAPPLALYVFKFSLLISMATSLGVSLIGVFIGLIKDDYLKTVEVAAVGSLSTMGLACFMNGLLPITLSTLIGSALYMILWKISKNILPRNLVYYPTSVNYADFGDKVKVGDDEPAESSENTSEDDSASSSNEANQFTTTGESVSVSTSESTSASDEPVTSESNGDNHADE